MSLKKSVIIHDYDTAVVKARSYCAYQERSQQEVRDKLYQLGLHRKEVEQAIAQLVGEGFINEQRFANTFAGGKFRVKQWGKVRIEMALKAKKVSPNCIRAALAGIDDQDYLKTLEKVVRNRSRQVQESDGLKKKYQVARYVISRGFESRLVWKILGVDGDE